MRKIYGITERSRHFCSNTNISNTKSCIINAKLGKMVLMIKANAKNNRLFSKGSLRELF